MLKKKLDQPVGVIGSGSFGTTVAKLLSYNNDVLIFSRQEAIIQQINESHLYNQVKLAKNIRATNSLEEVGQMCSLIFPVVPSASFRRMMTAFSPFLKPYHILIHGTKGFDLTGVDENQLTADNISRDNLRTISEVILDESSVVRVGCLSGPNLSSEILAGQPTAAVIA
ncbi:MAG: glycerol 3-phosphate dehydrogenase, partial [Saprospiraceae bacterium]